MIAGLLLGVLLPLAFAAGLWIGIRHGRVYLDAAQSVSSQTQWAISEVQKVVPTAEDLNRIAERVTTQTDAINYLHKSQTEMFDFAREALGIKTSADKPKTPGIDPFAEQVGG